MLTARAGFVLVVSSLFACTATTTSSESSNPNGSNGSSGEPPPAATSTGTSPVPPPPPPQEITFGYSSVPLPSTPPKQVLLQTGLEDSQVNNDVTRLLARLYQAKLVAPAPRKVFGLEEAAPPIRGANAYQEIDFGVPPRTATNRPAAKETDTHEKPRRTPKIQDQAWQFLETGQIEATCTDVCNPE